MINDETWAENVTLRKAPGNSLFDYGQTIHLKDIHQQLNENSVDFWSESRGICGCTFRKWFLIYLPYFCMSHIFFYVDIFQLQLISSWGDDFYIGLNGVEFYDINAKLMQIEKSSATEERENAWKLFWFCFCLGLHVFPESVAILEEAKNDPRTSDNLINGCNETLDPKQMWLTPKFPDQVRKIAENCGVEDLQNFCL